MPLLVLWMGYEQREATGTSLAAISDHRRAGRRGAGALRQRRPRQGPRWSAAPAVAGVLAGTALQQRISERAVAGAFVVLLVISAAVLIF